MNAVNINTIYILFLAQTVCKLIDLSLMTRANIKFVQ